MGVDIDRLFDAADFDHSGGIGYTAFISACTFPCEGSEEELAREAFQAMDADRDGWVTLQEIRKLFRERDVRFLETLPQERPFSLQEWCTCVSAHNKRAIAKRNCRKLRSLGC